MEDLFDIKNLKKEMPYKWRVQSFSKNKKSASCVAYIDSRLVQDLLDEVVGSENWQDKYYECKGNLFCSIGIKINGEWVYKTDCGTESNVDKQKGESSDAFKRAAVKWGIGRFLYSLKIMWVDSDMVKTAGNWPSVVDSNGKKVWDLTKHINGMNGNSGNNNGQQPKGNLTGQSNNQTADQCPREYLTQEYINTNWNGQLYANNTIYFNNTKFFVNQAQAEWFKKHPKFKPE